ncbi:hypothetical protein I4U23_029684 [Adineta vaga]|nr:hypothetical protein I4U23_029684 [Adineta vaga]
MPVTGHCRTSRFNQKSIQFIRRLSSFSSRTFHHQKKQHVPLLLPQADNITLNLNTSAFTESSPKTILRSGMMLTTFDTSTTKIPQAPPLPMNFTEKLSTETLKSTEFTKGIKSRTSSITPSGTDLSHLMLIRPSQIMEPPPIIQMARSKTYCNPITKSNLRNRRRTPLTPDVLALTKLRHPEHVKSSIVQRIEELKQASLTNSQSMDEKSTLIPSEKQTDLFITCEYKNTNQERQWLEDQTQKNSLIRFLNTKNYLQLNNRLFQIRSIEFIDNTNVRFYAQEKVFEENFLTKYLKQISIITILILILLIIGLLALAHAGYSAAQHRVYVRLTEQQFERLPADIIVQTLIAFIACCFGTVQLFGKFKPILITAEWQNKTWDTIGNRPSFMTFNHRGKKLFH